MFSEHIWYMEIYLCISVNAAAVYDLISNNQTEGKNKQI